MLMHDRRWTTDDDSRQPITICHLSDSDDLKMYWRTLKIFVSWTIEQISTKLGIKHLLVKRSQGFTNKEHLFIEKGVITFFSENQRYDIIIDLSKCAYLFKMVSRVSDVARGSLKYLWPWMFDENFNMLTLLWEWGVNYLQLMMLV